jgi:hypothetical protein
MCELELVDCLLVRGQAWPVRSSFAAVILFETYGMAFRIHTLPESAE